MAKPAQPYTTENPEVRKPEVNTEEVQGTGKVPVYEADPTRLDLSRDYPERVTHTVQLDEVVGPDHPAAVIVPPEGRGTHPDLNLDAPSPEEVLAAGDAPEATGVRDGEVLTGSEAEKRDAEKS